MSDWTPGPWRVGRLMEEMAPRPEGMTPEQGATWDRLMAERNQYRRDNDGAFVVLAGTMAADNLKRVGAATFQGTAKRGQTHSAPDPEGLANACLIAAAPELLRELHAAPEIDDSGSESSAEFMARYREWYEGTRLETVAKAEGRDLLQRERVA